MTGDIGAGVPGEEDILPGTHLKLERDLVIANEFAEVTIRRVATHNGTRLEVRSPRLGRSIRLDPLQLESLTWQEPDAFSALLVDPFGPPPLVSPPVPADPVPAGGAEAPAVGTR